MISEALKPLVEFYQLLFHGKLGEVYLYYKGRKLLVEDHLFSVLNQDGKHIFQKGDFKDAIDALVGFDVEARM